MYAVRNYDVKDYTFENMVAQARTNLIMKQLIKNAPLAKAACLEKAGKETDTPWYAIYRDDEYQPEFKSCYNDTMKSMLEAHQQKHAELPSVLQDQQWDGQLDEETAEAKFETAFEKNLINELYDSDWDIWEKLKAKFTAKWEGRPIPEDDADADSGAPAGGDDDGGDDDDE